ncbi:MAG: hypothetical protein U9Q92_05905 [archaeon]|nr:hypothetical protein [archaeon]
MFGKNKNSKEAVLRDKQEQFKNQRKTHESDIEKNILVLEDSISNLKGDFDTAAEIKNIKGSLAKLSEIKDKLREMEDTNLITKLETIQAEDDLHNLTGDVETLKTKVDLLSGAIKMISTKIAETPKLASQDTKKGAKDIEKMTNSLKSELDSVKKRLDSGESKGYAQKITELEHKYCSLDADFKKFISTVKEKLDLKDKELKSITSPENLKAGAADSTNQREFDAIKKEVTSLKSAVDKVENLLEASTQSAKEFESRINENNEKILAQLNAHEKSIDEKAADICNSKAGHIRQDIHQDLGDTNKEEIDKLSNDIILCRNETATLAEKLKSFDEFKRKIDELPEQNEAYKHRIDSLDNQVKSLNELKNTTEDLERHLYDLDKKLADVGLSKKEFLEKLSSEDAFRNYLKYVPVIKENISKLYKVYNRTEKRVNDIESNINEIEALKKNPEASIPRDLNETVKKAVDSELKEVVENINTLSADIKSQTASELQKQNVLMDTLKKDYETRIHSLKSEIANIQNKKENAKSHNYEEFAEFKARTLSEIDELRRDMRDFGQKISSDELENIVDNKLTPHVSNQDNIAKSLTLLNRKVEQKHLEVSKNTHEKINTSVKSIMDRISQIENDLNLLKDMRVDLVDDITTILDHSGKEKANVNISTKKLEEKYDNKLKELAEKIESIQHESSASKDAEMQDTKALAKGIRSIQYENEILKQELEKIKNLYFQTLQHKEEVPIIIE